MIPEFFTRPRRALLLGAGFVAFVLLLALVIPSGPLSIDRHFTGGSNETLHRLALFFDKLGGPRGRIVTLTTIGIVMVVTRRWVALVTGAVALALTGLLTLVLKIAVGRPRPVDALIHVPGQSFPSGHSSYAGALAVVLVLSFTPPGRRRLWWPLAALAMAAMGWSRVYLHVHWFSDVVAGALLGSGIALVCFAAVSASRRTSTVCAPDTP
jgi:undecaprenyl-diphosphatase